MNRIDALFRRLKKSKEKALIPFVTAGDPDLATTEALIHELERSGADLVEIGMPFSDPLADGPTIQAASQRALGKGVTTDDILELVSRLRTRSKIPVVLMGYYNPILQYGLSRFAAKATSCGVDGTIIPDLPLEEAGPWMKEAGRNGLANILIVAPTTPEDRIRRIAAASRGFIYYVSVTGITGTRTELPQDVRAGISKVKDMTDKPVCVGFGISTPEQVTLLAHVADGVIVGSALVRIIERNTLSEGGGFIAGPGLMDKVGAFVRALKDATITA